jgi:hypothetical protein
MQAVVFFTRTIVPTEPVDVVGETVLSAVAVLGDWLVGCDSLISDLFKWKSQGFKGGKFRLVRRVIDSGASPDSERCSRLGGG